MLLVLGCEKDELKQLLNGSYVCNTDHFIICHNGLNHTCATLHQFGADKETYQNIYLPHINFIQKVQDRLKLKPHFH